MSFWTKFSQSRIFYLGYLVKIIKSEHHHLIQQIKISLGKKIHRKQTILSLWTKFPQKEYFRSKTRKTNIAIEFSILELLCILWSWRNPLFENFFFYNEVHLLKIKYSTKKMPWDRGYFNVSNPTLRKIP